MILQAGSYWCLLRGLNLFDYDSINFNHIESIPEIAHWFQFEAVLPEADLGEGHLWFGTKEGRMPETNICKLAHLCSECFLWKNNNPKGLGAQPVSFATRHSKRNNLYSYDLVCLERASKLPMACAMPWAKAGLMVYLAMYLQETEIGTWSGKKMLKESNACSQARLKRVQTSAQFNWSMFTNILHFNMTWKWVEMIVDSKVCCRTLASWCACCRLQCLLAEALVAASSLGLCETAQLSNVLGNGQAYEKSSTVCTADSSLLPATLIERLTPVPTPKHYIHKYQTQGQQYLLCPQLHHPSNIHLLQSPK